MSPARQTMRGRRVPPRTTRRPAPKSKGLKSSLLTGLIWLLAAVNLVLVLSLISRIVAPENPPQGVLKAEDSLKVEVLNGCGKPGLAKEVTDYLRQRGFDVVSFGNYQIGDKLNFNVPKTLVIDRRSMDLRNAKRVAEALGVARSEVLAELNEAKALDVTVILGKDYRDLRLYRD